MQPLPIGCTRLSHITARAHHFTKRYIDNNSLGLVGGEGRGKVGWAVYFILVVTMYVFTLMGWSAVCLLHESDMVKRERENYVLCVLHVLSCNLFLLRTFLLR